MKTFIALPLLVCLFVVSVTCQSSTANDTTNNIPPPVITEDNSTRQDSMETSATQNSTNATTIQNSTVTPTTQNSTVTPPTQNSTNTPTTQNSTVALPTQNSTVAPPTQNSTVAPPTQNSTVAPPTQNSTIAPPTQNSTVAPTTQNSTVAPPTQNSTVAPPTQNSTVAPPTQNSTVAPPTQNSTVAPPTQNSTVAPPTQNSTVAPPTQNSTVAPPTQNSTVAPPTQNSTVAPPTQNSTVAPPTQNSTDAPTTQNSTDTSTKKPSSGTSTQPSPSNPCAAATCGGDSSCIALKDEYFCLCVEGYYYNETSTECERGKVFPGSVQVNAEEGWDNVTSEGYQNLYRTITNFFADVFNNTDYGQTVILKISESSSARNGIHARAGSLNVSIVNIFSENTEENETTVTSKIVASTINNGSAISNYASTPMCEYYGCEDDGKNCGNGLGCTCKTGLQRPNPQAFCSGIATCPVDCKSENHKQCVLNKDQEVECMCLAGYEKDDRGNCQKCAIGYSGVNCEDSFQLILIIVGSIAAIIIIGLGIALIVLKSKSKKNNIEEQNLIQNEYHDLKLQQTTGFSNPAADSGLFPRVRAKSSSQPQNPYTSQNRMPYPDY